MGRGKGGNVKEEQKEKCDAERRSSRERVEKCTTKPESERKSRVKKLNTKKFFAFIFET